MHDDMPHLGAQIAARMAARNLLITGMRDRMAAADAAADSDGEAVAPYVSISRLHGAGGAELAERVGAKLGWPVLDRAVVEAVAKELRVDRKALAALDNGAASWVTDVLVEVWPVEAVSRDAYSAHLRHVLRVIATRGPAVYLGRAAHLFLPRDRGLSVRVVASLPDRVARVRARTGLDEAHALAEIESTDRSRDHFVTRTFDRKPADPDLYDLVVNTSHVPIEVLADTIAGVARRLPRPAGTAAGVGGARVQVTAPTSQPGLAR